MKNILPKWDLSAYYSGIDDPKIKLDAKRSLSKATAFSVKYRSQINEKVSSAVLLKALKDAEAIYNDAAKPAVFSHLMHSTHSTDPKVGALMQKTNKAYMDVRNSMLFFDLAITNFSQKKLETLIKDSVLRNYKNFLKRLLVSKPHRLSEPEEKILTVKSLTSGSAFIRLFDEHFAAKKFEMKDGRRALSLSENKVLDYLKHPDRKLRKSAAESLTKGLTQDSRLLTYIFNTLGEDKVINDQLARYSTPEESRHSDNEINQQIVDVMSDVIDKNYKLVAEYYKFKKEILGYKELFDFDRYAPVGKLDKKISFEQAKNIILKSFRKFSPVMADTAQLFFDNGWIDAAPKNGKRGGAFCSQGTRDKHPVVFMNYENRIDDVVTLAHELGHAVNGYLMRKQTPFNFENPLVLAETASIFAEMLVFDDLKSLITDKKELLSLYMSKIEHTISTVFRQQAMYKFEQAFHNARKEQGELTTQKISEMWRASQVKVYGNSVTLTSGYDLWWSYIPHFLHTPFYVYAYAFGELLTISLYAKYKEQGDMFVPEYLKLLEAGDIASPEELLTPLGIDLKDSAFWEGGLKFIGDLIKTAKRLR